jgi:hypothetical protein
MAIKEFLSSIVDSLQGEGSEAEKGQATPLNTVVSTPNKLIYPLNNQERYGASITFKVFELVPPTLKGDSATVSSMLGDGGDSKYKELNDESKAIDKQYANKQIDYREYKDKKTRVKNSMDARYIEKHGKDSPMEYSDRNIEDTGNMVKLYLPIALTQADGLSYAQPELGPFGAGAAAAMGQGKGILETLGEAAEKGFSNMADMVAGNLQGAAAGLALQRTAAAMNGTAGNAASLAFGVTVNPNARTVFKGVNIREFAFQFKFIPKSSLEAKEVEKIIKRFRSYAYPDTINIAGVNAGYKYPHMFELDLFYENEAGVKKRVGTKMKKCHLKAISTNYNASSMSFHSDGHPTEIDLSLSFVEERTLNRADIMDEDGF